MTEEGGYPTDKKYETLVEQEQGRFTESFKGEAFIMAKLLAAIADQLVEINKCLHWISIDHGLSGHKEDKE